VEFSVAAPLEIDVLLKIVVSLKIEVALRARVWLMAVHGSNDCSLVVGAARVEASNAGAAPRTMAVPFMAVNVTS
jgi:hypothetical protein